jgi:cell division cycle protein 20 (cofactor of APC complex)
MDENTPDYISSVSWIQKGHILAIGNSKNAVELWDVNKKVCLRQMKSHTARIGCLSWNSHVLSSGSRSGHIHNHDVRIAKHHLATLKTHAQEVCGLKWNSDGRHLASGANDNLVAIWDTNSSGGSSSQNASASSTANELAPLHVLHDHLAAVKAVAWCPWQNNVLATGGGTLDRTIKIWNMYNGALLQNHDVRSQVCNNICNQIGRFSSLFFEVFQYLSFGWNSYKKAILF